MRALTSPTARSFSCLTCLTELDVAHNKLVDIHPALLALTRLCSGARPPRPAPRPCCLAASRGGKQRTRDEIFSKPLLERISPSFGNECRGDYDDNPMPRHL